MVLSDGPLLFDLLDGAIEIKDSQICHRISQIGETQVPERWRRVHFTSVPCKLSMTLAGMSSDGWR